MKRLLTCSSLIILSACKTTSSTPLQAVTIKPKALIGTAYDAVTQEFTGVSCLDLGALTADDYEMRTLGSFRTEEREGTNARELESVFGAFQKSFYNAATGLRLSRPYEMVQKILENDSDVVSLRLVQSEYGGLRFKPEGLAKLRLSREAQTMVQQILIAESGERAQLVDAFVQTCGTGFLSGMRYKLSMAASLRWVFKNPADKERWSADLRASELDSSPEVPQNVPIVRLRYESHMKETRDISLRALGESGVRDCPSDGLAPCLDAFRLFSNATVPTWQKLVTPHADDFDSVLPLAFLSDPEVVAYQDVEPALAGIALGPTQAESEAWQKAREQFVELYARTYRKVQAYERRGATERAQKTQVFLQQISVDAAPCYRPLLQRDLCLKNAELLSLAGEQL
jgi:hypothetical protein